MCGIDLFPNVNAVHRVFVQTSNEANDLLPSQQEAGPQTLTDRGQTLAAFSRSWLHSEEIPHLLITFPLFTYPPY